MQLLELFHELTIRPQNAKELKSLILQLAVQGRLTKKWRIENTDTEHASKLFKRVKEYNEELLKSKGRRTKKINKDVELELDLPNTWLQVKNQELFTLQKGKNPKDLSETIKKYPYQDIEALDRGNIRRYSDDEKAPKCTKDDILVVCDGSRSGLVLDGNDGIVGSTLAIIETPPFIQSYIKIIFLQDFARANANMIGAAIPHLDTKTLLNTDIGFPPLEEQKAIVEIVESLFKEVEQLETLTEERVQLKEDFATSALRQLTEGNTSSEWQQLQPQFASFFDNEVNIKKLRKSILQLAVQGKLTTNWRVERRSSEVEIEPASELLKRIQAEKEQLIREKKIKKEKPLPPITEEEIPYELPKGWEWCRLGEIITLKSGQDLKPSEYSDEKEIGLPYVTGASNLQNEEVIISRWTDRPRSIAYDGDLLLTCKGSGVGKMGWLKVKEAHIARQIMAVNTIGCELGYVKFLLDVQVSHFKENANGLIPGIDRNTVLSLITGLPSVEEQKAIVEKVNQLMAYCDELEEQVKQSQTHAEQLMQSVLREVFGK